MKTLFCGLLIVLLLTGISIAKPVYFMSVGAGARNDQASAGRLGFGGDVEVGLRKSNLEVYTGVQLGMLPGPDLTEYTAPFWVPMMETRGWIARGGDVSYQRMLFGVRFLNVLPEGAPVCGFVGGGASLGRARADLVMDPSDYYSSDTRWAGTEESGISAGWFAEIGLRLRPLQAISFDVAAQHHAFKSNFWTDGRVGSVSRSMGITSILARMLYTL